MQRGRLEIGTADVSIDTAMVRCAKERQMLMEQLWHKNGMDDMRFGRELTIISWQRMPGDDKLA